MINKYFNFQNKHKNFYLFLLSIITIFFIFNAFSLKINTNFSTIFDQTEPITYTVSGTFDQNEINKNLQYYNNITKTDSIAIAKKSIPTNFDETQSFISADIEEEQTDLPNESHILLMIKSPNLFTPVYLNSLFSSLKALNNKNTVQKISSIFDYITIEKKGTRLSIVPMSSHNVDELWTDQEVADLKLRIASDPTATGYLVGKDLDSVIFNIEISNLSEQEIYDLLEIFAPLEKYDTSFAITGLLPINYRVMYYLSHDLILLLILCFIIILIVFYLSFRAKRAMFLPTFLSLIGIIWTFGTMSLLNIPLTIVNIITPCMVLILGSSYSVHIVSEYYEVFNSGQNSKLAEISASRIYKTIFFAGLTTIAGFISLLISEIQILKEFGIVVSIGIAYCILISLTLLPILLSKIPNPKAVQAQVIKNGLLTRLIKKISVIIIKHWIWFCLLYVLIIIGFILTKDNISIDTNYMEYFPSSDRIVEDTKDISTIFGGDIPYMITISAPEGSTDYFLNPENLAKVYNFETTVTQSPDILQNISFSSYVAYLNKTYSGNEEIPTNKALLNLFNRLMILLKQNDAGLISKTISEDANQVTIYFQVYDSTNDNLATVTSSEQLEKLMISAIPLLPSGCTVTFGGTNSDALRFSNQLIKDQQNSQIIAYLLVLLIASLAFRSFYKGILTLIPVSVGVMANYIFMYILNIPFDMVTVSFASVAIGAGVDDAIHFLLKYTKLLSRSKENYKVCLSNTLLETGRPIVLTTVSIVMGMMMLSFGSYLPIRYFGILMSLALMNSMLATIIILPSIIILVEKIKIIVKK